MSIVGNRIKSKREELRLTQEQLAEKMGYKSRSTINKIEKGIIDISQTKVMQFSAVLGCSPAYLMNWEEPNFEEIAHDDSDSLDKELIAIIQTLDDDKIRNLIQYAKFLQKEE